MFPTSDSHKVLKATEVIGCLKCLCPDLAPVLSDVLISCQRCILTVLSWKSGSIQLLGHLKITLWWLVFYFCFCFLGVFF